MGSSADERRAVAAAAASDVGLKAFQMRWCVPYLPSAEGLARSFGSSLAEKLDAADLVAQGAASSPVEKASRHWSTSCVLSAGGLVLQDLNLEAS